MSKVKSPKEKKRLSLERDRRNVFGENSKASRKNIPRAKQRSHMKQRRRVAQLLSGLSGQVSEPEAAVVGYNVKLETADCERWAFEKTPDKPLREFIERQNSRETRKQRRERNDANRTRPK